MSHNLSKILFTFAMIINLCQLTINKKLISDIDFENYNSNPVSTDVSLLNDDVLAGSLISATLTIDKKVNSVNLNKSSDNIELSITDNKDGTYTSNIHTDGKPGEYYIILSNDDLIDAKSTELTSIYIYSNGVYDSVSSCSIDDAKSKYFINHVATEEELVLLEQKEKTDDFIPTKTRYEAESRYADITYTKEDITSTYYVSNIYSNRIIIEGTVVWYDEKGNSHPLKNNLVILRDDNFFWYEKLGTTYTDEYGYFSFEIDNETYSKINGRDLFVTLYSKTKSTSVKRIVLGEYMYPTQKISNISCNSKIEYNIDIYPGVSDRSSAFEITQAENIPYNYVYEMSDIKLPNLNIYYPAFNSNNCYFNNVLNYVAVGRKFYRDWDCLNHEYGHYINKYFNLCDYSVGGSHGIDENLIESQNNKIRGLKLAMSEGLATYIGTAAQMYYADIYSNYPRVGDEKYESVNNAAANYSKYKYGVSGNEYGEGYESSIPSTLIKLLDDNKREYDEVSLGHQKMWEAITSKCHTYMSELICTILSQNEYLFFGIGKILELEGYSPLLDTYGNLLLNTDSNNYCWTFYWDKSGGTVGQPNRFTLTFEGEKHDIFTIENINDTSIKLNNFQINSVLKLSGTSIKWYITSYNDNEITTGGYVSSNGTCNKPSSSLLTLDNLTTSTLESGKTKWFRFTAPYKGTYYFESSGNLDLYGEIFNNFVIDRTNDNVLSYNDNSGIDDSNFKVNISLEYGQTIYLRVSGNEYDSNIYGDFAILTRVDHVHVYTSYYVNYSKSKHQSYCECGKYVLRPHNTDSSNSKIINGHTYCSCLDCKASIDLGNTYVFIN